MRRAVSLRKGPFFVAGIRLITAGATYLRLPRPTGDGVGEIFCVLVLTEDGLRRDAKDQAARRFQKRPKVATILAIVDFDWLLPDGAL